MPGRGASVLVALEFHEMIPGDTFYSLRRHLRWCRFLNKILVARKRVSATFCGIACWPLLTLMSLAVLGCTGSTQSWSHVAILGSKDWPRERHEYGSHEARTPRLVGGAGDHLEGAGSDLPNTAPVGGMT